MKNGQIFARKSTARGGLDLEYLDETSRRKVSLRERAEMDQQIGKKLKHFTDYASKESLGQVHVANPSIYFLLAPRFQPRAVARLDDLQKRG